MKILASIQPGSPRAVRVYACSQDSNLRTRLVDVKFDRTPTAAELRDLLRQPQAFVEAADRPEVA